MKVLPSTKPFIIIFLKIKHLFNASRPCLLSSCTVRLHLRRRGGVARHSDLLDHAIEATTRSPAVVGEMQEKRDRDLAAIRYMSDKRTKFVCEKQTSSCMSATAIYSPRLGLWQVSRNLWSRYSGSWRKIRAGAVYNLCSQEWS